MIQLFALLDRIIAVLPNAVKLKKFLFKFVQKLN
jgi:hypothetical protein